ncbi:hypothetical protein [Salipiger sp. PrR003]|uniref:hypothetical protein n=1 Tax=Salipiger sp. PrR003 TaxID=2706776 RepID=UPI003519DEC9
MRPVEPLRCWATLGMAADQNKTAKVTALAVMAELTGKAIPETGTTIFRPAPLRVGAHAPRHALRGAKSLARAGNRRLPPRGVTSRQRGFVPGDTQAASGRGGQSPDLGPMDKPRRAAYLRGRRPPTPRREGRSPACRSS